MWGKPCDSLPTPPKKTMQLVWGYEKFSKKYWKRRFCVIERRFCMKKKVNIWPLMLCYAQNPKKGPR